MRMAFARQSRSGFYLIVGLLIIIGTLRIVSASSAYWETKDEAFTIVTGMEWLDKGQYTLEQFHPPLARVMSALGPFAAGVRYSREKVTYREADHEANVLLNTSGKYERNLSLARMGVLPFFFIGTLAVACWTRLIAGPVAALLAALLFTTLPPILAHAGLATLDMACAGLVAAALFSLVSWLKTPSLSLSLLLGATAGLSILSKFSALAFIIATAMLAAATMFLIRRVDPERGSPIKKQVWVRQGCVVLTACIMTICAGYRFSWGYVILPSHGPYDEINHFVGNAGTIHDAVYTVLQNTPVIAPEFLKGLAHFFTRNKFGHVAYMFGDIRSDGRWYYFPITVLVKTPIAFLILVVAGLWYGVRDLKDKEKDPLLLLAPVLAVIAVLSIGMVGKVNNGVRQILSVYPLLSIIAGYGAVRWCSRSRLTTFVVTCLLSWQITSSLSAHPDYLSYFNPVAMNRPYDYGVDSDVDWGQDFKRLAATLTEREIKLVHMNKNDAVAVNVAKANLPIIQELVPNRHVSGWVAISTGSLFLGTYEAPYNQFYWLRNFSPVQRVGQSILLYHIPEGV